ncbi:GbsR/MarR family transcriptional regulator [Shouchella shacheensis]|uniref:GbsR/MarR family transcriptional regulator n=1 Tax=Shouchella shacheensis TaxID=1649580 RepID=UPI00073FFA5F|nr:GbsR/MarR family transcriptional regulator [Shouchella shacheensis]
MERKISDEISKIEEQFIERIADNMRTYGVSTTVGRVLGIIYTKRRPMTLEELSEDTGMSKTRMSQVVREMVSLNVADKVYEKGVRKDLYNVEQDYYQTFISIFSANWQAVVTKNKAVGKKLRSEIHQFLKDEQHRLTTEETEKLHSLLRESNNWLDYYEWIDRVIDFFESGDVFTHIPKPTDRGS